MGKYFGTDGVRGVAGADLTCEMAMLIGRGAAAVLTSSLGVTMVDSRCRCASIKPGARYFPPRSISFFPR